MSKKYTSVEVFCDTRGSGFRITESGIRRVAYLSMKKVNGNRDDNDVVFNFHDLPVRDKDKPKDMPTEAWVMCNYEAMKSMVRDFFCCGVNQKYAKMGIQKLTEKIKRETGESNEKAFEIATQLMEHKNVPSTHVMWICNEDSPSFLKFYVRSHNDHLQSVIDNANKNGEPIPTMICLEENNDESIKPEDFLGNGSSRQQQLTSEGEVRSV